MADRETTPAEGSTFQDFGDEDFKWPEVKDLKPAEALRLMADIESAATAANKRAKILASRKATAKTVATQVLEIYELDTAKTTLADGTKVQYTPYDFDAYDVVDEEAFRAWAEDQNESFYEPAARLREGVFRDEMRRRDKDREPLPPGVRKWTDKRLSRSGTKPKG